MVETLVDAAEGDRGGPAVVLAPSAGAGMGQPVLAGMAAGLAGHGYPVLRFDFGYLAEGRRRPDPPAALRATWLEALDEARRRFGDDRPLVCGGRSMGGRIATLLAAEGLPCAGLLLLAYPLHPARRPYRSPPAAGADAPTSPKLRTDHWPTIVAPTLFLSGDRDALCDLDLLARERADHLVMAPSRVHVLRGADHGFAVRKQDGRTAADVLAEAVAAAVDWLHHDLAPDASMGT